MKKKKCTKLITYIWLFMFSTFIFLIFSKFLSYHVNYKQVFEMKLTNLSSKFGRILLLSYTHTHKEKEIYNTEPKTKEAFSLFIVEGLNI